METMHAAGRRRLPPVPRPAGDRSASGQVAVATDETDPDQFATQVIDTRQIAAEIIEAELAALTEADAEEATEAGEDAADASDQVVDDDEIEATQQLLLHELVALIYDTDAESESDAESENEAENEAEAEADAESEADDETTDEESTDGEPDEAKADTETSVEAEAEPDVVAQVEDAPAAPEARAETAAVTQDPAQQFVARLRSSAADFAGAAGAESAVVREAVPPARHRRARCRLVLRYADGDLVDVTLLGPAGTPGRPSRHGFDRQILRWLGTGLVQDDAWLVDDPDAPEGVAVDLTAWVAEG